MCVCLVCVCLVCVCLVCVCLVCVCLVCVCVCLVCVCVCVCVYLSIFKRYAIRATRLIHVFYSCYHDPHLDSHLNLHPTNTHSYWLETKNYMDLPSRTTWESDIFLTFHLRFPPLFRISGLSIFCFRFLFLVSCLPTDEATAKSDHNLSNRFGQQTAT